MSKLSDKEIAYFSDQLPEGMAVVDFREVQEPDDFIRKYCPETMRKEGIPYKLKLHSAIFYFIKQVKNNGK